MAQVISLIIYVIFSGYLLVCQERKIRKLRIKVENADKKMDKIIQEYNTEAYRNIIYQNSFLNSYCDKDEYEYEIEERV